MENHNLYYWKFYDSRGGKIEGLFFATEEELKRAYNKTVTLGAVLGKHSEIYGDFEESDVTLRLGDRETIQTLMTMVTMTEHNTLCGYNPLHYISWECVNCESTCYPEEMYDEQICLDCFERYDRMEPGILDGEV